MSKHKRQHKSNLEQAVDVSEQLLLEIGELCYYIDKQIEEEKKRSKDASSNRK